MLCDWKDVELSEYFKAVYAYGKGSGKRAEYPIDKALSSITTEDLPLLGQGHPYYTALFNLVIPKNGKTGNQLKIEITDTASRQFTLDVTL